MIVDGDRRIVSTGYNGVQPGQAGCLSGACPRGLLSAAECLPGGTETPKSAYNNCISTHAEDNAIRYAQFDGYDRTRATTIYTNMAPCGGCLELIAKARIDRAVWPEGQLML